MSNGPTQFDLGILYFTRYILKLIDLTCEKINLTSHFFCLNTIINGHLTTATIINNNDF